MSDLTEFLHARIGEDEAIARAASTNGAELWLEFGHVCTGRSRVLAECEAKRRIVAEYREMIEPGEDGFAEWREDMSYDDLWPEYGGGIFYALRLAVRVLATVYADHPDYRPEWRP